MALPASKASTTPGLQKGVDANADVTDVELIERMTRGDRAALSALYERHAATLLAVVLLIVRDRHDAEDVVHDVFLEVWRNCGSYSAALASVRTWLVVRARSRSLDRLRANQRRRAVGEATQAAVPPEQATAGSTQDRQRLLSALAQVPEAQQGVITLAYFEGLSTTEIAERLGIPVGTVKSRAHAALKALRRLLGNADE
jgi:RNA polymerase sigma-70 factor, ECF subfamily